MAKQKLTFFGHVMRGAGLEMSVMMGMGGGSRSRGRPKTRWLDEIRDLTCMSLYELNCAIRDNAAWRKIVTKGHNDPMEHGKW